MARSKDRSDLSLVVPKHIIKAMAKLEAFTDMQSFSVLCASFLQQIIVSSSTNISVSLCVLGQKCDESPKMIFELLATCHRLQLHSKSKVRSDL